LNEGIMYINSRFLNIIHSERKKAKKKSNTHRVTRNEKRFTCRRYWDREEAAAAAAAVVDDDDDDDDDDDGGGDEDEDENRARAVWGLVRVFRVGLRFCVGLPVPEACAKDEGGTGWW
jgi:hypothetical protein